jgi:hypothetical protein
MRFMILRKADAETEASVMPSEQLLTDMGEFMEEMGKAGVLLGGEGLHPSVRGARVDFSRRGSTVTDGPFAEAKELIAGYCLIQVDSLEQAVDWARRWPPLDANGELELEIRQVAEAEDFGEAFTPELREQEARLRAQLGHE